MLKRSLFTPADEERSFLISEELQFRTGELEGAPTFIWRDMEGDVDEFYEFVATGTNDPTRAFFETCMYRAMYERKYRKSADDTTDAELEEFIRKSVLYTIVYCCAMLIVFYFRTVIRPSPDKEKDEAKVAETTPAAESMPATTSKSEAVSAPAAAVTEDPNAEVLLTYPAELHLWDATQGFFVKQADVSASIAQHTSAGPFDYWLLVRSDSGPSLTHKITSDMNQRWSAKMLAFTWNHIGDTGAQSSWCLRFEATEPYEQFQALFSRALWESLNNYSWEKAKVSSSHCSAVGCTDLAL